MNAMRRAHVLVLGLVVACAQTSATSTTLIAPALPSTSTTEAGQAFVVQDCMNPPVTFSALCEVYELIQDWHVDRPIAAPELAQVALRALENYSGDETEPRPRSLICAVPTEDFDLICEELARMVEEREVAVGPAVDAAVIAMADLGLDPFSYYVPPEQVGSFRANGVVGGVGLLLDATDIVGSKCAQISEACQLNVVFVLEENPGAEAGLMAGDTIISVDGESVNGLGFAATATMIAGDETGTVEITVDRNGEVLDFEIERQELEVPTVQVDVPRPSVGYIRIPDFEDDIPRLVRDGLDSINASAPRTIIVDLRDNPGGFVDAAVDVASEFISGGLVLETFGPDEHFEYPASSGGLATDQRLVVLVNEGSASAAEILAGALRDRRNATIVGTSTFGKDAVQIAFNLRNGGELYVAVARWVTPNGISAANGGLIPDRELEFATDLSIEEVVAAALDAAS